MKPVLHSVSYAGLWGQDALGFEDFLRHAKDLGYAGVMPMMKRPHVSPLDYDAEKIDELAALLEELGLSVPCLAGYNDPHAGLGAAGGSFAPLGETQLIAIQAWCGMAQRLGAPVLRLFTGLARSGDSYHAHWQRTVRFLREACGIAGDYGVVIGVQNHDDVAVHHLSLRDLIEEVDRPNCKACFDAWACALHGDDLAEAVRVMAPFIVHTTVADYVIRPRFRYHHPGDGNVYEPMLDDVRATAPGTGFIDYPRFFDALRDSGYDGAVAFEMCSPILGGGGRENLDRYARRFLDFFQPWVS